MQSKLISLTLTKRQLIMKKILAILTIIIATLGVNAQQNAPELTVGQAAPEFSLPDPQGKQVSLKSLQGKWVVLDFWGSWCRWCIKGIPEMKESYKALNNKVTFVGVACRDPKDTWLNALKQYELPWLNLWDDPDNTTVMKLYQLRGFPTKIIIDPKGIIRNITLGEDPEFYTTLNALVK